MNADPCVPARVGALLALLCAGCAVGPDYQPPAVSSSAQWGELASSASSTETAMRAPGPTSTPDAGEPALAEWWTTFHDPMLDQLVARAIAGNLDLKVAESRVREARAQRAVVASELLPDLEPNASYTRERVSGSSLLVNSAATSTDAASTTPGVGSAAVETDFFQAGFDAAWEVDVFGGARRAIEESDAELAAGIEARRDVLVSLLGEVARNYVELRGAERRVAIARTNLAAQQETLDIIRTRAEAGLASDLDVARAEAQARTTAAEIPTLETTARRAIHALSVLLAKEPNALGDELSVEAPVPPAPPRVPVGLPSDLLRRRPDVRRAERQLAAATARIGVVTAELFPRFSLTGSFGLQNTKLSHLTDGDSRFWSFGPSVSWPVLDLWRVSSQIHVEDERAHQAAAAYQLTVLTSFREVEDSLVALSREQSRRDSLAGAVDSNRRAVDLANQVYQAGRTDFLTVLQSQRDLYASEDALAQSERDVASSLVALYKALGGGWEIESREEPTVSSTGAPGHAEDVRPLANSADWRASKWGSSKRV